MDEWMIDRKISRQTEDYKAVFVMKVTDRIL